MQLTNIFVAALAAGSATATSIANRSGRGARQGESPRVGANDGNFGVADLTNGVVAKKVLSFDTAPFAAGPCSLIGQLNEGFPIDLGGAEFSRLNVRNVATGALVRSFPPIKVVDDRVAEFTFVTINSFVCEPNMTFEFSIADDSDADLDGNVTFTSSTEGGFFVQNGDQCPQ